LIAVLLESEISGVYAPGDLLIVEKGLSSSGGEKLVYEKTTKKLSVVSELCIDFNAVCVIGDVLEERFNGQ
jgi:hypothetical protein